MSLRVRSLRTTTIDIQVLAEERYNIDDEIDELEIETLLTRRLLLAYPAAYKISSLIKEILDQNTILYRIYAKVTVPIDKATKQMFEFKAVPKTRFEYIIDDMD